MSPPQPLALYLAKDAALSAFAFGRQTALVLSSGAEITSAVPVRRKGQCAVRGRRVWGCAGGWQAVRVLSLDSPPARAMA